jgi:hypothetical protein
MHHRFDTRTKINIDVELWLKGLSLGCFQTRDIDSMGVFIEAPGTGLQLHDVVEIDFLLDPAGMDTPTQCGVVVRCVEDGIAVMFVAANAALFEALGDQLLDRYPPQYGTLAS